MLRAVDVLSLNFAMKAAALAEISPETIASRKNSRILRDNCSQGTIRQSNLP